MFHINCTWFTALSVISFSALLGTGNAFTTPTPTTSLIAQNLILTSQLNNNVSPYSFPNLIISSDQVEAVDKGIEEAFQDDIIYFDSTIQLIGGAAIVLVLLAAAAKFFLDKMDEAIEKVLVDFERTMKDKYASRWVSIEAKLDGLQEPERSQKLFSIMEELQTSEPQFMDKVNKDMAR